MAKRKVVEKVTENSSLVFDSNEKEVKMKVKFTTFLMCSAASVGLGVACVNAGAVGAALVSGLGFVLMTVGVVGLIRSASAAIAATMPDSDGKLNDVELW